MHPSSVAVIGAGFSGTLFSLGLQAAAPAGTQIHLIERSGRFGPGLAFGAAHLGHLLNVPAERMGAFPDRPADFLAWLGGRAVDAQGVFVPRALYGAYLEDRLRASRSGMDSGTIALWHDQVIALTPSAGGTRLQFASGHAITVDIVVLAMGNDSPQPPFDTTSLDAAGLWRSDPWEPGALDGLDPDVPVLLVGTGLTMVDAVVSLLDGGHRGPIHAVSRRGLLPRPHLDLPASPAILGQPLPHDLRSLMRHVRHEMDRVLAAGQPWQPVMDAVRHHTQALWTGLDTAERKRFLRHLRPWWDVHRHRMAPRIASRIAHARDAGQLRPQAGRIVGVAVRDGAAMVRIRPRGSALVETLGACRVVNCTGPGSDVTRSGDPFVQSLLRDGVARPDPLRLGLDVTALAEVVDGNGAAAPHLFALGALTKGQWWEITSVPDIRKQCQSVAGTVAERLSAVSSGYVPGSIRVGASRSGSAPAP
jgi:uncharacterized NAD(P)/FAD-binding protein YdhS